MTIDGVRIWRAVKSALFPLNSPRFRGLTYKTLLRSDWVYGKPNSRDAVSFRYSPSTSFRLMDGALALLASPSSPFCVVFILVLQKRTSDSGNRAVVHKYRHGRFNFYCPDSVRIYTVPVPTTDIIQPEMFVLDHLCLKQTYSIQKSFGRIFGDSEGLKDAHFFKLHNHNMLAEASLHVPNTLERSNKISILTIFWPLAPSSIFPYTSTNIFHIAVIHHI